MMRTTSNVRRLPCGALGAVMALLVAACGGNIGTGATDGDPSGVEPPSSGRGGDRGTGSAAGRNGGSGGTAVVPPGVESAGAMPLRRLTIEQYDQTILSLLGDDTKPGQTRFAKDPKSPSGFIEPGLVADTDVRAYQDVGETVAQAAAARVKDLFTCAGGDEAGCFDTFAQTFGARAFRRPITDEEKERFRTLYKTARTTLKYDYPNAVRLAIQAILQAPSFLYRWELGPAKPAVKDGLVKLTGYELASRLSYLVWNDTPDAALTASAAGGKLVTPVDVEREVKRLLADPRARKTVESFHRQWLDLEKVTQAPKDPGLYPSYTPELAQAMEAESLAFVDDVMLNGDGKVETLLAAPVSFVNAALAKLYGAAGVTGTAVKRVDAVPHRVGLLTQAGFLSSHAFAYDANPISRGATIYKRVLCGQVERPNFPIPDPKPLKDGVPNRQRFSEHATDPQCAGCHKLFDPPGFALESYGAIGEYRTKSQNVTVDASGTLTLPSGKQVAFQNGEEMVKAIAASDDAKACAATQWGRYMLGRQATAEDKASFDGASDAFRAAQFDVRAFIVALAKSKTFMYRKPTPEEVTQ